MGANVIELKLFPVLSVERGCSTTRANKRFQDTSRMEEQKTKIGAKMLIAAIFSLSIGVAFASPLIVSDLIVPFRRAPQGPTADFGVDVVYANFAVQEPADSETSGVSSLPQVNYRVVLNITNYGDIAAKLGTVNFAAAQNITLLKGASEGASASSSGGGNSGGHFGTVIEGLWLDNEWLNVTWIPGVHPDGLDDAMTNNPWGSGDTVRYVGAMPTVIPSLPANASETGYLMEGVPIRQYYFFNSSASTLQLWDTIYVNGTWVNVTGRIRIENPVTSVLEFGTFIQASTYFWPRNTVVSGSAPSNSTHSHVFMVWSGNDDFNNTWAAGQSRLIQLTGTTTVGSNELKVLTSGSFNVYAATYNYIYDQPVNGTFYDTSSLNTQLKSISLEKTADGIYIYNSILGENQMFQPDQFGVEVFIKDRS